MGSELPKQFLELRGKPILAHTVERWLRILPASQIWVAMQPAEWDRWRTLCLPHLPVEASEIRLSEAGASRTETVRKALNAIDEKYAGKSTPQQVAIHDGVRPLASVDLLSKCCQTGWMQGAVLPAVPVVSTLRQVQSDGSSKTVDRNLYREVQTPQVFPFSAIHRAYQAWPPALEATDDAQIWESQNPAPMLIPGVRSNLKVTTPEDLKWAEGLLG
jgi:2-C-methyl-D-erythritol 4-phosphate cytidylyltransferase